MAVIGLAGVLGAAVIANWDKLMHHNIFHPASNETTAKQVGWQKQDSYKGNCQARPGGTVCAAYDDGFVWLIRGGISGWEKQVENGKTVQTAIATTGKYEHVLGTNNVRVTH